MTLLLFIFLGFAGFFLLLRLINWTSPERPLTLKIILNYIHAALTEFFYLIVLSAIYGINLEKRNPKAVSNKNQRPILFIHGLYHNSSGWWKFIKQFRQSKIEPLFTINLGNPFGSVNQHAYKVKDMVSHIQKMTGRKDIILIGHSMGGLVAAKFALDLATEDTEVTNIITIGSPLKGAWLANYLGWGKSSQEMNNKSAYTLELSEKICRNKQIQFFHIAARPDLMVPLSSALLLENKNAKHLVLQDLGHVGLLFSNLVIDPIIDYYHENCE